MSVFFVFELYVGDAPGSSVNAKRYLYCFYFSILLKLLSYLFLVNCERHIHDAQSFVRIHNLLLPQLFLFFLRPRDDHFNTTASKLELSSHFLESQLSFFLRFHGDPAFATELVSRWLQVDFHNNAKSGEHFFDFRLRGFRTNKVDVKILTRICK